MTTMSKWYIPFTAIIILVFLLSFRMLSDPDLGFHLKAGKWILENREIPRHDISTYTVSNHEYIDLHWLFQVFVFSFYRSGGYTALSLLVTFLSLSLLCLLLLRNRMYGIPAPITSVLLLSAYLIIEPRIMLRPEMLTFIYISAVLIILDKYYYTRKNYLFFIPGIMLLWCNTQALFILGLILLFAYFISVSIKKRTLDRAFLLWMVISMFICLCNPYFFKGFTFPLELFTRFEHDNIFNQHIREFISIFHMKTFTVKEYLFLIFSFFTLFLSVLTWKKRKPHEFILILLFLYLSLIAIRNIPLFIIIVFPILSTALKEVNEKIRYRFRNTFRKSFHIIESLLIVLLTIVTLGLSARIYTNAYYVSNKSYNKTGMGIDTYQQPVLVSAFLKQNHLSGKIINSLCIGGWLSWSIPQPVFIDARLEVIREDLYQEVYNSWNGGLQEMIEKYRPDLITYNYQVYYPWTEQLLQHPEWRLIYIDGIAVVFARQGYKPTMGAPATFGILSKFNLSTWLDSTEIMHILNRGENSSPITWLEGFYKKYDYSINALQNIGSFYFQTRDYATAKIFFLHALQKSAGKNPALFAALSEISRITGENAINPALIYPPGITRENSEKAIIHFNNGNQNYIEGKFSAAIAEFTMAIKLNPGYYKAYNNRAIIRAFSLKQFSASLSDFDSAIRLNPSYGDAYMGRGSVKFQLKDLDGACRDWRRGADMGSTKALKLIEKTCSGR